LSLLGLVRHMAEVPDPEVVAEAWEVWRAEVAFTDRFVAEAPDGHADLLRERIDGRVGQ
jgi:hypothetical protein